MSDVTIWHNARCSKSRETLALLRARGIEPTIVLYLDTPPSRDELTRVLTLLGITPIELMRRREKRFGELGLGADSPAETLISAMAKNPILIERPVVLANGHAALGRPPENVLAIL